MVQNVDFYFIKASLQLIDEISKDHLWSTYYLQSTMCTQVYKCNISFSSYNFVRCVLSFFSFYGYEYNYVQKKFSNLYNFTHLVSDTDLTPKPVL